jgi:hypothetical protein
MKGLTGPLLIGVDVEVRKHHAFRFSRAAAAEDDGGQVVHGQGGVLSAGPFDQARRRAESHEARREFLTCADGAGHVLQPHDRRSVRQLQLGLLDEDPAGDDGAKAGKPHGSFEA